jgi:peptidoglycan/LPS O-acetylase OafA/YrhL
MRAPTRRGRYLPGIDGLRAIAVVAVLLYHAGLSWLPGGFLGVDVFFVISGYLITVLLLGEHHRTGDISVRRFYVRRARRLLPALFTLLLVVTAVAAVFARDELAQLRAQVLAAMSYSTNWYLIVTGGSYFQQLGQPLILRHLWSLAVEEQFYLLWPLVLLLLLRRFKGRLGPVAATVSVISVASVVWMAVLFRPGTDPSRVYFGTDTRVFTLLIGALLALFWRPDALEHGTARRHGRLFDVLGLFALAAIVVFFLDAHETSTSLYRGGFLVVALISAAAIAAATHPTATVGSKLLGHPVLIWIGLRSYALYLWHWPIFMVTRPGVDVPLGPVPDLGLRLGLTVIAADLSYRLVELPIRRGGFRRWVRHALRTHQPHPGRRPVGGTIVAIASGALTVLIASAVTAKAPVNEIAQSLRAGQQAIASADGSVVPTSSAPPSPEVPTLTTAGQEGRTLQPATGPSEQRRSITSATTRTTAGLADGQGRASSTPSTATGAATSSGATAGATTPTTNALMRANSVDAGSVVPPASHASSTTTGTTAATTATSTPAAPVAVGPIVGFGDSVMLGAAPALLQTFGPGTIIDAKVGRTLYPIINIAHLMQAQGRLGQRVLIHLGDNGGINPSLIAQTMASLEGVDRVIWVTVKVPRAWEATVNQTLATEIPKYANARLLDWHALATDPTMFYSDGIHLRPSGARFYASLVQKAFAAT